MTEFHLHVAKAHQTRDDYMICALNPQNSLTMPLSIQNSARFAANIERALTDIHDLFKKTSVPPKKSNGGEKVALAEGHGLPKRIK